MTSLLSAAWMQSDAEGGSSFETILLLFGIVVFVILAPRLIRMGRQRPAPSAEPDAPRERHAPSSIRVRETVDRALVELVDTSREISAQIDNRIRMLNKLVKDADEERTRLESLLAQIRAERDAGGLTNAGARVAPQQIVPDLPARDGAEASTEMRPHRPHIDTPQCDKGDAVTVTPEQGDASKAGAGGAPAAQDSGRAEEARVTPAGVGTAMNQAYARIATLAAEGRSSAEIARTMRLSTAEVNLVLHILESKKG